MWAIFSFFLWRKFSILPLPLLEKWVVCDEKPFCLLFCTMPPAAGAGLTGSKMARRTGSVDEFEFKPLGESSNQGVSIYHFLFLFGLFSFYDLFLSLHLCAFQQWYLYMFNWIFQTLVVIQLLCQRLAVEILISGLVFNEKDFIRPWEGKIDNLERYRLFTTFHLLEIPSLQFSFSIWIIQEISWFFHILSI